MTPDLATKLAAIKDACRLGAALAGDMPGPWRPLLVAIDALEQIKHADHWNATGARGDLERIAAAWEPEGLARTL